MAGLVPRVSGSWKVQFKAQLIRSSSCWVERGEQSVDWASRHEVGTDEASELEQAGDGMLSVFRHAQKQVGNEGDRDLDAHSVFRHPDEALDAQGLLDPAKEQLDLPALLVEIGNLLGRSIEIVADDAKDLAAVDADAKHANRELHGIAAAGREPLRQKADLVAQDVAARGDPLGLDHSQRRVLLQPSDEAAARRVDL